MTYHGKIDLSVKDYLFLNLAATTKNYIAYSGLSLMICYLFFVSFMRDFTITKQIISLFLLFSVTFLSLIFIQVIGLLIWLKKLPHYIGQRKFIINNEGVELKQLENNEGNFYSWEEFQGLINLKKYWLLKIDDKQIKVIPHAAFKKNEILKINQLMNSKIDVLK
ncbi:YcxB family protein [Jeotgalibaca ciconiae]|uniref:YcxB-like C-terminal domain-containing protein n=1 Tax=Jeotgalibaca ciconiae TaxID=2496265 RepID=A0A3Q9BKD6_9LACT|nr:YcxB family protein [Jeotgalibaca ciconiae]AZP04318.1 hypothetical protein EJN90_06500 [Jeotgalibaca ciconiae]HIY57449.1 YcxB family protein [Candidatus Tetragenococcus pullicola]HJB23582.1 YcxB family protein [Candidatus Jeotgalibaca pullicola]